MKVDILLKKERQKERNLDQKETIVANVNKMNVMTMIYKKQKQKQQQKTKTKHKTF